MEHIWKLTDPTDLIIALFEHLSEKTRDGEDASCLSKPERVFYITQCLEMEVNNGGFSQFFFNSGGNFSNELVDAFMEIGATTTADICRKVLSVFGREIPVDRQERQTLLEQLEDDEIDEFFNECDNYFLAYEDNLEELNYQFIMKNRDSFT